MKFTIALYLSGWKNAFKLRGKATRSEYWAFLGINILIALVLALLEPAIAAAWFFLVFIPMLTIVSRRLLDAGYSHQWIIVPVILFMLNFALMAILEGRSGNAEGGELVVIINCLAMGCFILPGIPASEKSIVEDGEQPLVETGVTLTGKVYDSDGTLRVFRDRLFLRWRNGLLRRSLDVPLSQIVNVMAGEEGNTLYFTAIQIQADGSRREKEYALVVDSVKECQHLLAILPDAQTEAFQMQEAAGKTFGKYGWSILFIVIICFFAGDKLYIYLTYRYAEAQYNLGTCYYKGHGVPQDYIEAVKLYRKAAERGVAEAQYNLGICYYEGNGIPQDYTEAVKWCRKAAEQGHAGAQHSLGVCYCSGEGVPQNYWEAAKWLREAAEQGHVHAQRGLGACYAEGLGVAENPTEAVKWYRKAAEQGDTQAMQILNEKKNSW